MSGTVVQVSRSLGGVPKLPVPEAAVGPLGLEGDRHNRPDIHGGPRQAVLLISAENIEVLQEEGWPVFFGALGENLTVRGLDFRQLRLGQRLRTGEIILEITKVRAPCATLNPYGQGIQAAIYDATIKRGEVTSPLYGRAGFYARVLTTGTVRTGDPVQLLDQAV